MIVVVDYGVGNLSSVCNMLRKAGAVVRVSSDFAEILSAEKLLLPGVGHFDHAMKMLGSSGLRETLDRFALELRRPVLGICLGAQILGKQSEEGKEPGLGWIDMTCRRLEARAGIRVPHMGWNEIAVRASSALLDEISMDARFYFAHSYYIECVNSADILATTRYGIEFTCAIKHKNIYGTQFHPEKSLRDGLALMQAFVRMPS